MGWELEVSLQIEINLKLEFQHQFQPVSNQNQLNPIQPSTLNSQLSTLNSQLSTLNSQLSTLNSQLSTLKGYFSQKLIQKKMPSIFKSRSNKSKQPSSTPIKSTLSSSSSTSTHSNHLINSSHSLPSLHHPSNQQSSTYKPTHLDDFGRPILNPTPAFALTSTSTSSSVQSPELQLLYGYTGLYTQIELDIKTTSQLIKLISNQLKSRPLDSPLLFSSHALDLSIDSIHSLIRSFINRHHSHFLRDIQISTPHNLSAFLKWVLARYLNPQSQHGLLNWSSYLLWRQTEIDSHYPSDSITNQLLNTLTSTSAEILITLLDLFSSVAAYSHLNGITIHKCGAIFGAFIFGLEDDLPFEQTYSNWLRYAHATEHMILAYLRDQKAKSTTGEIASRLESCIRSYPKVIPSLTSTHPSARLESVARFRRNVRFYNKNLIQNASKWEVKGSKTWQRLLSDHHSSPNLNSLTSNPTHKQNQPIFTKSYKHLLNINTETELEGLDENERNEIDLETQRFKSLVEKQWSGFISKGFEDGVNGNSETEKKLEFDLDETEKQQRRQRRETMDWDSFAGSGFVGRETYTPKELLFNTTVSNKVMNWPIEEKDLSKKLYKTHKILPEFPYDIEPIEHEPILVDDNFFEAWVDSLIASGWTRDELKEVSWALIQYKSKFNHSSSSPNSMISNSLSIDTRHDEIWVLFEEVVPEDYRMMLMKNGGDKSNAKRSRRISFLKAVITRSHKDHHSSKKQTGSNSQTLTPTSSSLGVINEYGGQPMTKKITLTPDLTSSASFSDVNSMASYPNSQHPSERTIGDSNRLNPGSGTGGGTGFMAEFRARAKKRQQSYNIGTHSSNPHHQTQPSNQHLNQRGEEWVDIRTDEDLNPIPLRPHHPTPPSILSSSRSITPNQERIKNHHESPKRRVVPNRKESLVNSLHSDGVSQADRLTDESHRGSHMTHSSSLTSLDLSVRTGEGQEEIEKKSYGSMTPKKERKDQDDRYEEEEDYQSIKSLKEKEKFKFQDNQQQTNVKKGFEKSVITSNSNNKISFPTEENSIQRKSNSSEGSFDNNSNSIKLLSTKNSNIPGLESNSSIPINQNLNSSQGSSNKSIPKNTNLNEKINFISKNVKKSNSINSISSSSIQKPLNSNPESSSTKSNLIMNSLSPPRNLNPIVLGRSSSPNQTNNRYLTPQKQILESNTKLTSSNSSTSTSNSSNSIDRYDLNSRNHESRKKIEEIKFKLKSKPNQSLSHSKYDSEFNKTLSNGININQIKEGFKPIQVFEKSKVQKVSKIVDMFEKSEPTNIIKVDKTLSIKEKKVIENVENLINQNQEDLKEGKGSKKVISSSVGIDGDGDGDKLGKGTADLVSGIPVRQFKLSRVGEE